MPPKDNNYLEQLTWLRGGAALLVVLAHTVRAADARYTGSDEGLGLILNSMVGLGTFGVVLFFTLSGTTLLISTHNRSFSLPRFYMKRVLRIWPAFLVSLLAYIVFAKVFSYFYIEPKGHWIEQQYLAQYESGDLISYIFLLFNIRGEAGLFNNAYWSLPVEFQYYLLFPLALLLLNLIGSIGPLLLGAALFLVYMSGRSGFESDLVFMVGYSFFGGVVLGHIKVTRNPSLTPLLGLPLLLSCFLLGWSLHSAPFVPDHLPLLSNVWNWYVGTALLSVAAMLYCKFSLPEVIRKVVNVYGQISYSTYLYHNLVIGILVLVMINININDGLTKFLFLFAGTVGLTYILAKISYQHIERPFMSLLPYKPTNANKAQSVAQAQRAAGMRRG